MKTVMVPVLVHPSNAHLLPSELDATVAAAEILWKTGGVQQQNTAFSLLFSAISLIEKANMIS